MRKLLYATTALTTAALIAGAAGDAAAQTAPTTPSSPYRERPPEVTPTTPAPAPTTPPAPKAAERIKLGPERLFPTVGGDHRSKPEKPRRPDRRSGAGRHAEDAADQYGRQQAQLGNLRHRPDDARQWSDDRRQRSDRGELESRSPSTNSYLFVQSPTMGQLIVGDENNAGYLLHVTAPDGGISLDSGDLCNIRAFEVGEQAFPRVAAASSSTARSAPPTCVCSTTTPESSPTSRRDSPASRRAYPTFRSSRTAATTTAP